MAGSMTEIPVNGDAVPAYISLPPSGSGPAVVVIQEWWGLVPHIRDVCRPARRRGLRGPGPRPVPGQGDHRARRGRQAHDGAAARAGGQGHGRRGRRPAGHAGDHRRGGRRRRLLHGRRARPVPGLAQARGHGRACRYYGLSPGRRLEPDWSTLEAAVLGHYAEQDDFAPPELAERIAARAARRRASTPTSTRYPGTDHAFFNDTRPEVHDAEAAETSWRRTLEFLRASSRPDGLSGSMVGYADRRRGVVQRGRCPDEHAVRTVGASAHPVPHPGRGRTRPSSRLASPQGPDRAGGPLGD